MATASFTHDAAVEDDDDEDEDADEDAARPAMRVTLIAERTTPLRANIILSWYPRFLSQSEGNKVRMEKRVCVCGA